MVRFWRTVSNKVEQYVYSLWIGVYKKKNVFIKLVGS